VPKSARKRSIPWSWIAAAAVGIALFAAWRVLPVQDWLKDFQDWIAGLGSWGGVVYGVAYVVAALLFVPGIVLTIGAGYVFGLAWGVVIVSIASTVAAVIAFLIARYAARGSVQRLARRSEKFEAIDRAIGENGWKVVGLLRLSPIVPFSVSNYLYGLTSVRLLPYLLASWVGMLPATVLYVSLGAAGRSAGEEKGGRSPWEWALLAAGLLATAAVTVLLTRIARKQLKREHLGGRA
jgi:uncharacterized membrane protein YdjX (TVP38/TMEM64 family)